MTTIPVENNPPIVTLTATGGQTEFAFGYLIQTAAQLQVIRTPTGGGTPVTLSLDVDYTVPVSAIGTNSGGSITLTAGSFPTGATAGDLFTLSREIPITRQSAFPFRGTYNADTINFQLDTIFLVLQEQERDISRAFTLNIADALSTIELPLDTERASRFLAFDGSGVPIASAGPAGSTPVSTFAETLLDDPDAATARSTLGAQQDVITTRGDLVRGSSAGAAERLALGTSGQLVSSDGTDVVYVDQSSLSVGFPPEYISSYTLNNDTDTDHDINVTAMSARDDADGANIVLSSEITKRMDASFAEGDDQGGLDGTEAVDGTPDADSPLYIWLIGKTDGTADVLGSLSSSSPTLPSGFTLKRLLGAVRINSSNNVVNDHFTYFNQGSPLDGLFLSESQTYTAANTVYTWDHELGVAPREMEIHAVCLVAQSGYAVGDVVVVNDNATNGGGSTLAATATQVFLTVDNSIAVVNRTTPANASMTVNNWDLRVTLRG